MLSPYSARYATDSTRIAIRTGAVLQKQGVNGERSAMLKRKNYQFDVLQTKIPSHLSANRWDGPIISDVFEGKRRFHINWRR
jgi:hypothetical protein